MHFQKILQRWYSKFTAFYAFCFNREYWISLYQSSISLFQYLRRRLRLGWRSWRTLTPSLTTTSTWSTPDTSSLNSSNTCLRRYRIHNTQYSQNTSCQNQIVHDTHKGTDYTPYNQSIINMSEKVHNAYCTSEKVIERCIQFFSTGIFIYYLLEAISFKTWMLV